MNEALRIRRPSKNDLPFLKELWETTFGDPPELIDAFFAYFPPIEYGWAACLDGKIVSAAYLLTGNRYQVAGASLPAYYVYAVATPEAYRGNGYAGALMQQFYRIAAQQEALLYTRPASDKLFQWYAAVMHTVPAESLVCKTLSAEKCCKSGGDIRRITAEAYAERREKILTHKPHIRMHHSFLSLQEKYLEAERGGFYALGTAVFALEQHEETIVIKELLSSDSTSETLASHIAAVMGAKKVRLSMPQDGGAPLVAYCGSIPEKTLSWGLLLD